SAMVLRVKRYNVPWARSFGFPIVWLSTPRIVDSQGMRLGCGVAGLRSTRLGNRPLHCGPPSTHKKTLDMCYCVIVYYNSIGQGCPFGDDPQVSCRGTEYLQRTPLPEGEGIRRKKYEIHSFGVTHYSNVARYCSFRAV